MFLFVVSFALVINRRTILILGSTYKSFYKLEGIPINLTENIRIKTVQSIADGRENTIVIGSSRCVGRNTRSVVLWGLHGPIIRGPATGSNALDALRIIAKNCN